MSATEPAPAATAAATISVSSSHELYVAIQTLSETGGGTITVRNAGEDYRVNAFKMGHDTGLIRVVAEDPDDPPTFTELRVTESQNFSFEGFVFDSSEVYRDRPGYINDINVGGSHNIAIRDSVFRSTADGTFTGTGSATLGESLGRVIDSTDFVFSGNTVSHYFQGLTLQDSVGSTVSDNSFARMQGDGLRLTGVQDTLIENNTFQSFYGTSQDVNHSDMIQLWATGSTKLVTDGLTIRGNVFNSTDGLGSQTMFLGNELAKDGTGPKYGTITVEDNTIYNGHLNGVAIYNTDMAIVRNNTLLWDTEAQMYSGAESEGENYAPQIRLYDVTDGIVTGNVASNYYAPGIDTSDNAIVNYSSTSAENHVSHHFVNVGNGGVVDLRDLEMLPDSPWVGVYGADQRKLTDDSGQAVAVLHQAVDPADPFLVHYSADLSRDGSGAPIPADAVVRWTFSDGTVREGVTIQHRLATPGEVDVTLEIVNPDGSQDTITRLTRIEDPVLLRLDFEDGVHDTSSYATDLTASAGADTVAGRDDDGGGFRLDGDTKINIDRAVDHLHGLDSFAISLDLRQLPEDSDSGVFLHSHQSMIGEITKSGALKFSMATTEGWFSVTSDPGVVTADTWHELRISYNGFDGGLRLEVDGGTVAHRADVAGTLANAHKYDLNIGNTWGPSLQADVDNILFLSSDMLGADRVGPHVEPAPDPAPAPAPDIVGPLAEADLLRFDFDGDRVADLSGHDTRVDADSAMLVDGVQGGGLYLDGSGGSGDVRILRGADQIALNDSLSIGVSLKQEGQAGTFLHMHRGLTAEVTDAGAVRVSMATTEGWYTLTSDAGVIDADTWHRVLASYDDATDSFALYVDGDRVAETEASGLALTRSDAYHLNLGNTWNASMTGVLDDVAMAAVALDAEAAARDHLAMIAQHDTLM